MNVDVGVVILTCNQRGVTLRCLSSFESVDDSSIGILVWDNGSSDGTRKAVREEFPDVEVRSSNRNLGAAAGRNAGARAAMEKWNPEFLFFVDNDTVFTRGLIRSLRDPFDEEDGVGMTTPKILLLSSPDRIDCAGGCRVQFYRGETTDIGHGELDRGQYDARRDCVPGGIALVRSEIFTEVGGFDATFDPYGAEDVDFSLRVKEAGYRCLYVPDAVIYHEGTQTFEQGQYSREYARQKARNWHRLVQKHANRFEKMSFWLVGVPTRLVSASVREFRRGNVGAVMGLISGGIKTLFWGNGDR